MEEVVSCINEKFVTWLKIYKWVKLIIYELEYN